MGGPTTAGVPTGADTGLPTRRGDLSPPPPPIFFMGMDVTHPPIRALLSAALVALAFGACDTNPNRLSLRPVTVGHIGGIPFTVTDGTIFQAEPDGPVYADATGGQLVLDDDPAALGMSDPDLLHLATRFALSDGGSYQIAAFGSAGSELSTGASVLLSRTGGSIAYEARFGGALFIDGLFSPPPAIPSAELWVVTEFYADSVPGYGPGQAGLTVWSLDDLTAAAGTDVLRCTAGPAIDATPLIGDRVGFALQRAWLVAIEIEDRITGPCTP